jgi:phosphoglycolate phosphatase
VAGSPKKLVLWDVDLTLVDLRGLGASWYSQALREVASTELTEFPSFPGRTERAITKELLRVHGVEPSDEIVSRMFEALVEIAGAESGSLAERGHALPGTHEVLAALREEPAVVQSLITGNLAPVARHKLAAFGLDEHLDLAIGGYGQLSEQRADLVAAAIGNAADKHGVAFADDAVIVVGDTPADIEGARAHRALAVGVATGRNSAGELRDAGADLVFDDLSDTGEVVQAFLR